MKKYLFTFLLGAAAGAGGFWFLQQEQSKTGLEQARDSVVDSAGKVKEAIHERISEVRVEDIKKELERTSVIVREKASQAGTAIADATANARTTAAVKTKYFTEPGLSALSINVDTTDGVVTLSGNVSSHEEIAKAVRLALETDGVRKVISTLQVKLK